MAAKASTHYRRAKRARESAEFWGRRADQVEREGDHEKAALYRRVAAQSADSVEMWKRCAREAAAEERREARKARATWRRIGKNDALGGDAPTGAPGFFGRLTRERRALRHAYLEGYGEGFEERERAFERGTPEALRPFYREARARALRWCKMAREAGTWRSYARGLLLKALQLRRRVVLPAAPPPEDVKPAWETAPEWSPCGPGCEGWHVSDDAEIVACDESGRFLIGGEQRDDYAAAFAGEAGREAVRAALAECFHCGGDPTEATCRGPDGSCAECGEKPE